MEEKKETESGIAECGNMRAKMDRVTGEWQEKLEQDC